MKKIILGVLFILLIVVGFFGYRYYNSTYVTTVGYAKVPSEEPKKEVEKDLDGKEVKGSYAYEYKLKFINDKGKEYNLGYGVTGANPKPYTTSSYVKADVSDNRVVSKPVEVNEKDIPKEILDKLNK